MTYDIKEEMKESQPKKSTVKIEELNGVTHDSHSGNDILFISSYHNAHALLANTNGETHTWILNSGHHSS